MTGKTSRGRPRVRAPFNSLLGALVKPPRVL